MAANLTEYISEARNRHIKDEQIKQSLLSLGWPQEQVAHALSPSDKNPLLIPPLPPSPALAIGMWTGFLYIIFFVSMYVLATAIAGLFHDMVDKFIPDVNSLEFSRINGYLLRGYIAAIIVSYPLFMILALALQRQLIKQPLVRNLRSRKILIYITLIGTFLIMLCHVIATIYTFLAGTLTTNALGHLAITFLIAGAIFGYFINEVKNDRKTQ